MESAVARVVEELRSAHEVGAALEELHHIEAGLVRNLEDLGLSAGDVQKHLDEAHEQTDLS